MSRHARPVRGDRLHLGVRDRVALGFGLMALALSALLAFLTWSVVSHNLLDQRQSSALVETTDNAMALDRSLHEGQSDIATLLGGLPSKNRSGSMLIYGGRWFATSVTQGPYTLPPALTRLVAGGSAARQRIELNGQPYLVVGVPLRTKGDGYFEVFRLGDLNSTYHVLSLTLVCVAFGTSLLGLLAGRFASRRVLRPLTAVTDAAAAIARGDLSARLRPEQEQDPDLGPLALSFNATADALQRRVEADARFACDVSHELRTPLMTMLNSVEVLQHRRGEMPVALREPLDLLSGDLHRFSRLVVDLLEVSRDDGGDLDRRETVLIGDLVTAAADAASGRRLTCVEDSARGLVLWVDKRRLERVVTNLVDNARAHGGGCTAVRVSGADGGARIEVDDAGPGIPATNRERIFERFARDAASSRGAGLGLAIVASHVRWHGGSVHVEGRASGGARFVVVLPVGRADA